MATGILEAILIKSIFFSYLSNDMETATVVIVIAIVTAILLGVWQQILKKLYRCGYIF